MHQKVQRHRKKKVRFRSMPIKPVATHQSQHLVIKGQEDFREEYKTSDLKCLTDGCSNLTSMDEQVSVASQDVMLSKQWFEGRQHLLRMSYCNGRAAASAAQKTTKLLPL